MNDNDGAGVFGPDTDLILSLFAIALLILATKTVHDRLVTSWEHLLAVAQAPPPEKEKPAEVLLELREDHGNAMFEQNEAVLTAKAEAVLGSTAKQIRAALTSGDYDQVQIQGFASPESVVGDAVRRERWNLALSVERSLAIIDYFYGEGIPYECMSLASFGRSHSRLLRAWLRSPKGGALARWDTHARELLEDQPSRFARERRVWVVGIQHPCSACPLSPAVRSSASAREKQCDELTESLVP